MTAEEADSLSFSRNKCGTWKPELQTTCCRWFSKACFA